MILDKPYILGITGAPASGKSLFASYFREHFSAAELAFLSMDRAEYWKASGHNDPEAFPASPGLPSGLDKQRFLQDFRRAARLLRPAGNPVGNLPRILCVEGRYLLNLPEVQQNLDYCIYLDCGSQQIAERLAGQGWAAAGISEEELKNRAEQATGQLAPLYQRHCQWRVENAGSKQALAETAGQMALFLRQYYF